MRTARQIDDERHSAVAPASDSIRNDNVRVFPMRCPRCRRRAEPDFSCASGISSVRCSACGDVPLLEADPAAAARRGSVEEEETHAALRNHLDDAVNRLRRDYEVVERRLLLLRAGTDIAAGAIVVIVALFVLNVVFPVGDEPAAPRWRAPERAPSPRIAAVPAERLGFAASGIGAAPPVTASPEIPASRLEDPGSSAPSTEPGEPPEQPVESAHVDAEPSASPPALPAALVDPAPKRIALAAPPRVAVRSAIAEPGIDRPRSPATDVDGPVPTAETAPATTAPIVAPPIVASAVLPQPPPPGPWARLEPGLTVEEVRALLGEPRWSEASLSHRFWMYEVRSILGAGVVVFENGRVFSWRGPSGEEGHARID